MGPVPQSIVRDPEVTGNSGGNCVRYGALMTLPSVLVAIFLLVVGALVAFASSWIGARIEARREHARWLRERRFEAYREYLRTADKWATRAKSPTEAGPVPPEQIFYDEMTAAEAGVELVGPRK